MTIGIEALPLDAEVGREPSAPAPAPGCALHYQGSRGLFGLLVKNILLGLLTLGLYRFWARTALRRYFWSAVTIDGEPLEYTGRGSELFIGFLVVLAVFVPVTIAYYIVQTMLVASDTAQGWLDIFYVIAVSLLVAAGQYRARRYRLSRTVWRGIRAAQDGSTWVYMGRYALWLAIFPLTLGLSAPWAATDLARYRIRHTVWGDQRGSFHGRATGLLGPWLLLWLSIMMPLLMMAGFIAIAALSMGFDKDFMEMFKIAITGYSEPVRFTFIGLALLSWLLLPFAYLYYSFRWLRWYVGGTQIGFLALSAGFRSFRLTLRVVFSYLLAMVLMLAALVLAAAVAGFFSDQPDIITTLKLPNFTIIATLAATGLLVYGLSGIATTMLIAVPVLRRIVDGISIAGLEHIDGVLQSTQQADRSGEGLADSFDIGIG